MAQRAALHSCFGSLSSREKSSLRLGQPIELFVIYVRHKWEYIPQVSDLLHSSPLGKIAEQRLHPALAVDAALAVGAVAVGEDAVDLFEGAVAA